MSSPEPKLDAPKTASSSPARDDLNKAVETFAYDVSAGESVSHVDSLKRTPPTERAVDDSIGPSDTESATDESPIHPQAEPQISSRAAPLAGVPTEAIAASVASAAKPKAKAVRRVTRHSSWWITSLAVHAIVLVVLAFTTLAIVHEEKLELYASPEVYEPIEEFQEVEFETTHELESLDEELNEPDPVQLEDVSSELLVEEPALAEETISESTSTEAMESFSELSGLTSSISGAVGGGDSQLGEGSGGGMAKFFGTEVKARRILYMLDNSGGMRKNGKFEALVSELNRSIRSLDAKQEFYVIFYSDTVYPLFYPNGVRKFVRSNERNVKLLERWLATVELCGGNAIDEALAAAEVIRPEAVFLLTDGDLFTTEKKKALLLNSTGRSYAIHTFGLGVRETTATAERLQQVAEANAGTFRSITVTDEMEALADQTQRPYHDKQPGAVWGLKVGSR